MITILITTIIIIVKGTKIYKLISWPSLTCFLNYHLENLHVDSFICMTLKCYS